MDAFPLPLLTLRHGPWRAEIADPRADPWALGARFVQGGYVAALWHGERCLTGRATPEWIAYNGQGLPEVFEEGIGRAEAAEGDEYLRLGAGRLRRRGANGSSQRPLSSTVNWRLIETGPDRCRWRCRDELRISGARFAYELERGLRLHDDGLESVTILRLDCPWSAPVIWFPHPFMDQADASGTMVDLPPGALVKGRRCRRWQADAVFGFGVATGVWGSRENVVMHLDQRRGGGSLAMQLDRPIDKVVLWSNPRTAAAEPYLARAWQRREQAAWTLRYRWRADPRR